MKKRELLLAIAVSLVASNVYADGVTLAYWDMTTNADIVGGIPTIDVGSPDRSVDGTYGSTIGSGGNSLNTILGGTANGGGFMEADVFEGSTLLDFETKDFSFSYWSFDDFGTFTGDGDGRGARVFDSLAGTTNGMQLGTNASNIYNFRMDDDAGNSVLSNNNLTTLQQPRDTWVHVGVTVDRANDVAAIYFNGSSVGSYNISALTGNINPSMDMQIGVINGGANVTGAQKSGLDDLAFYNGILSGTQLSDLANGNTTPGDYVNPVPEPSSAALIIFGGVGFMLRRRR